jgi:hypothetical protein
MSTGALIGRVGGRRSPGPNVTPVCSAGIWAVWLAQMIDLPARIVRWYPRLCLPLKEGTQMRRLIALVLLGCDGTQTHGAPSETGGAMQLPGSTESTGGQSAIGTTGGSRIATGGSSTAGGTGSRCDFIPECKNVPDNCTAVLSSSCGSCKQGAFECGNMSGWYFSDGTSFACTATASGLDCVDALANETKHCNSCLAGTGGASATGGSGTTGGRSNIVIGTGGLTGVNPQGGNGGATVATGGATVASTCITGVLNCPCYSPSGACGGGLICNNAATNPKCIVDTSVGGSTGTGGSKAAGGASIASTCVDGYLNCSCYSAGALTDACYSGLICASGVCKRDPTATTGGSTGVGGTMAAGGTSNGGVTAIPSTSCTGSTGTLNCPCFTSGQCASSTLTCNADRVCVSSI